MKILARMKWSVLPLLGLLTLSFSVKAQDFDDAEIPDDLSLEDDEALLRDLEEKHFSKNIARENELGERIQEDLAREFAGNPRQEVDPCTRIHCGAGRICLAEGGKPVCVCIQDCPQENNPRRRVCTSRNETWPSDCEVYRQRCLCSAKDPQCKDSKFSHIHIDYYGECKEIPECTEEEMSDFPRRMRDWLFNVMKDLAERDELSEHYKLMELEAETNLTRRWTNAAIWKFCDLDGDTDRSVSRHELFPIRAPLVSLEHCIAPFLDACDDSGDHIINLQEWAKCLELEESEMQAQCDNIVAGSNRIYG